MTTLYASEEELLARFSEAEIKKVTGGTFVDSQEIGRALAFASRRVESMLASRYAMPLDPVPDIIVDAVCDIARYRLHDDRVSETIQKRYDDAISFLQRVADGKETLGAETVPPEDTSVGGGAIDSEHDERIFSRDTLSDY